MFGLLINVLAVILGLSAAVGVVVMVFGLQPEPLSDADVVESRLRAYEGEVPTLSEIELAVPFSRRVLLPAIHRIGRAFDRMTPASVQQETQRKIMLANRPGGLSASDFMALRWVATVFFALLGVAVGALFRSPIAVAVGATLGTVFGLYLPLLWLNQTVRSRRQEIQEGLPDALDLLTVAVEAGLGLEAAMARVAERAESSLSGEFARVLQEARLGRPRLEALDEMGRRCGVDDLHNFVQAVIQSEQMGSSIAKILHIQSDEIRHKRLQKAQERGARASLMMLLPMVGCIFPAIWVILLGPAALILLQAIGQR